MPGGEVRAVGGHVSRGRQGRSLPSPGGKDGRSRSFSSSAREIVKGVSADRKEREGRWGEGGGR